MRAHNLSTGRRQISSRSDFSSLKKPKWKKPREIHWVIFEDVRVNNCHYLLTLSVSIPDMNSCSTVKLSKKSSDALGKE